MGMAASQARFLSLTARKSNTEYEGQQINQERTALANESSNLYSQLTKIDVPTPPATSDFYKTVYSFTSSDLSGNNTQLKYSLESIQATPDGDVVNLSHDVKVYQAAAIPMTGATSIDPNAGKEGFKPGQTTNIDKTSNTSPYGKEYNVSGGILSGMLFNTGDKTYAVYLEEAESHADSLKTLIGENGDRSKYVSEYTFDGTTKEYLSYVVIDNQKYYFADTQLANLNNNNSTDIGGGLQNIKQTTQTVTEEFPVDRYETNNNGRLTTIVVSTVNEDGTKTPHSYQLDCVKTQDEDAYEQAMRDYEYYQAKYEKNVSEINAKTEQIQQKDKSLELELKQLDTEQNAIKTEMDAVQKVVENNVETTFKTFG